MEATPFMRPVRPPTLFDGPLNRAAQRRSIDDRFREYHRANPRVYERFREIAHHLRCIGIERTSAKLIVERIRWNHHIRTRGEIFKINNIFTSRYARMLVKEDPSFEGFFEMRELKS